MNTSANENKCDINGQSDGKEIEITVVSPSHAIPNPRAVMVKMICEQRETFNLTSAQDETYFIRDALGAPFICRL